MTEIKHTPGVTPGDWQAKPYPLESRAVWAVRTVYVWGGLRTTSWPAICDNAMLDNEANARLISAAPELLKTLKRLIVYSVEEQEDVLNLSIDGRVVADFASDSEEAIVLLKFDAAARSAIAKATGTPP